MCSSSQILLVADTDFRSTAKVNFVNSSRTTKEIRDAHIAQQNPNAANPHGLFNYFKEALKEHGAPFTSSARPIVAGLILDSHFSIERNVILGHAALGCHDPKGISLGIFGSHLTYAWPRFIEEVTHCLTDTTHPGDKVGNDNGECQSMWEACTIGQGAFIHEVGHAFGAPHRPGIMERGYAHDWPKNFLVKTAYCKSKQKQGELITDSTPNGASWHLKDALMFNCLPHFRKAGDLILPQHILDETPQADAVASKKDPNTASILRFSNLSGIVQVSFNGIPESHPSVMDKAYELEYPVSDLRTRFPPSDDPVSISVVGFNGKACNIKDLWKFLNKRSSSYIRIPKTTIVIRKHTACSEEQENSPKDDDELYEWAQLLQTRDEDGNIHRVTSVDLCVGCIWDGGVVHYANGSTSHWGPMMHNGYEHRFGGHATETLVIPKGIKITKVEVNRTGWGAHEMGGVRVHLSNGTAVGELNEGNQKSDIVVLQPGHLEEVVGFCGKSDKESFCAVVEFGLLTVPAKTGIQGLPSQVYDMKELRNMAGLEDEIKSTGRGKRRRVR